MGSLIVVILFIAFLIWIGTPSNRSQKRVSYANPTTGKVEHTVRPLRKTRDTLAIEKPDIELSDEFKTVLDVLEHSSRNVFLTGKAGTGKSTLLKYFRATTTKFPVVVAPTGVAAVNVQGQTIHSFFQWGIDITPQRVRALSYEKAQVYRNMKTLIIDEISMVRADLFECIDKFLRLNTGKSNLPFGGVQIVAIGDLYQLPPVVKADERARFERLYKTPFFFSTDAYKAADFQKFELMTVRRQVQENFVNVLNNIREGSVSKEDLELLNACVVKEKPADFDDYVHLVTTNKMAQEINASRMTQLSTPQQTYAGLITGSFKEKDMPTELTLDLKSGAQIMLLNNDKQGRWVNGDIVKILETKNGSITVEFTDEHHSIAEILPHTWETIRFVYDEEQQRVVPEKVGSFTQIPVKPAWAITIHKAQGKTFEKVFIDLGRGAFAAGQTYVALSRCKTLEGLKLSTPIATDDVFVNEHVDKFMRPSNAQRLARTRSRPVRQRAPEKISAPIEKSEQLDKKTFVLNAIRNLRQGKYLGIHVVYSGFNEAFREYYGEDPIKAVDQLVDDGIVVKRIVKGGVMLYDRAEYEARQGSAASRTKSKALNKILKT